MEGAHCSPVVSFCPSLHPSPRMAQVVQNRNLDDLYPCRRRREQRQDVHCQVQTYFYSEVVRVICEKRTSARRMGKVVVTRIHVVEVHLHASPEYAWCVRLCCESAGGNGDMQKEAVENRVYEYCGFVDFGLGS
jgi:hypothetical protein